MSDAHLKSSKARWRPNLVFVACYCVLNALLFLPFILLMPESATILPSGSIFSWNLSLSTSQSLVWRDHFDLLRISGELTILTALWIFIPRVRNSLLRAVIYGVYLLAFCYAIYEAIVLSLFLAQPDFYSQYFWARDGLPFLASHIQNASWIVLAAAAGGAVGIGILLLLLGSLLNSAESPQLHPALRSTSLILAAFCLFVAVRYQIWTADPQMVVSSIAFKLERNIASSWQLYRDVASFDDQPIRAAYDYSPYQFAQKPNIYLIFIESYGSVLYKRPDYRRTYTRLLRELEQQIQDNGWSSASALSISPMWGGGSWMAYSSGLMGLRIDHQPQYLALFNKYQVERYPDLATTLQAQGYRFVWLSSISDELNEQEWTKQQRFHNVDQYLRYQDLNYQGPGYGWGPSPPDQYVLNYARETYLNRIDQPLFFFMITQNSHYPWIPQPTFVEDWRTLNQPAATGEASAPAVDPEAISHSIRRQNYMKAVEYQLRTLTDFVLHSDDKSSLYILVGDHQPPRVSRDADGWATPIHLLSRDAGLIQAFEEYGFVPGLTVKSLDTELHHEGIYSLLMRVLLERFGKQPLTLPAYLPSGVVAVSK